MSLSLISLNIERSKHLDLVVPFLEKAHADVVCLQELAESDIGRIASACGAQAALFEPMSRLKEIDGSHTVFGIAITSRHPFISQGAEYYVGDPSILPESDALDINTYTTGNRRILLTVKVEKDGARFTISNTHFTWSPAGATTDLQRADLQRLLAHLGNNERILVGDFNAPRGGEIFSTLATRYKDNIPAHYKTSIDASLHRAGKTHARQLSDKMVDGFFTTPEYIAHDVELIFGVSDHAAIRATISRNM